MARILLVEDNEMNRDCLCRLLQRKGYTVEVAVDGGEAVDAALAHPPDLILMDISLPVMDGLEATRRIRQDPRALLIPIIALTAHAMTSDRERALAAGCTDFETKPVELSRLLLKIEAHLAASRDGA